MSYPVKQMLVIRKDLNMRKGKIAAQAAHASLGAILKVLSIQPHGLARPSTFLEIQGMVSGPIAQWLEESFAKICVSVDSEQELLELQKTVDALGILNCLITDSGTTEFGGVPTVTCLAIGPEYSPVLDKLTGHLKLL